MCKVNLRFSVCSSTEVSSIYALKVQNKPFLYRGLVIITICTHKTCDKYAYILTWLYVFEM